ncbi:hypothetical protein AtubIFM55763_001298 [Aspergillus tubingensis]|uniref:Uncharacterized protein n=1 Tax=Aspergillus tubingensis TaxID=5068 RepID=A0A8H3SP31_ASPTU|nr:uncharacterized protein AtWU_03055 [Aspergillus tubingensis]GFN13257.1 hypothetical protein AtWU_03055 [Aspergillus tubingensis]GLA71018.1 hypothetical protein AtubIFM55763_001298 [Aspergillus tubingensis]GLA82077.1 hypothetical protein AtubIFM56815_006256 [Aspergillus tubingensis]GLA95929.1 hypothetical protein AtubIFM57143_002950 [Aspergillus tubingensis]GLB18314.1 hypothetical protein AtubIFM61612_008205 [Aspergillus tubingensis]
MPLLHTLLTTFLAAAAAASTTTALAASTTTTFPSTLNITTLTAHNNQSVLECWALDPGYSTSAQAGVSGTAMLNLGSVTNNATNLLIPGEYDGGRHNAPTNQWVIFLSGVAHITLPNSTDDAWIVGGKNGAILALDTAEVSALGHYTTYPTEESTVALEIALKEIPGHRVLHSGACGEGELL